MSEAEQCAFYATLLTRVLELYREKREVGGIMAHEKAKVYFDGNNYIAIPHTESPTAKKSGGTSYSVENDEKKKAFENAYKGAKAKDLAARFVKNFDKYTGNDAGKALVEAGPKV